MTVKTFYGLHQTSCIRRRPSTNFDYEKRYPAATQYLQNGCPAPELFARSVIEQFREMDEAMTRLQDVAGGQLNIAVTSAGSGR
ncbi:hypothetical protein WN982_21870 [Paraburkholderia sp. IMGN_8]|uniref:hypothetical protein n=1 Tax=Paraburkholderia sp. IMGN_8 TaxID=3136564 RepID=UPI003100EBB4